MARKKIVRDKIPELAAADVQSGKLEFHWLGLDHPRAVDLMDDKVWEEFIEFVDATTEDELIEEAADVFEAMVGRINAKTNGSRHDLVDRILWALDQKYKKRGGFEDGVLMTQRFSKVE